MSTFSIYLLITYFIFLSFSKLPTKRGRKLGNSFFFFCLHLFLLKFLITLLIILRRKSFLLSLTLKKIQIIFYNPLPFVFLLLINYAKRKSERERESDEFLIFRQDFFFQLLTKVSVIC